MNLDAPLAWLDKFELVSFNSAEDLAARVAGDWLEEIEAAGRAGRTHCVALSGGRIALKFFAAAAEQARARAVSFNHVHIFWADERCVPPDHGDSNFAVARQSLLAPLKIPESQVHRLRGETPPQVAADEAAAEICRVAPLNENARPVLDLVLLGMGEDGHVASL
ncbi:MAG: 6-phosphogluconolactonase, partial [Verrucomicrobia bacterium]|nr:6-phosphogluconolactonase [Verrucomicrobiota bacterium]